MSSSRNRLNVASCSGHFAAGSKSTSHSLEMRSSLRCGRRVSVRRSSVPLRKLNAAGSVSSCLGRIGIPGSDWASEIMALIRSRFSLFTAHDARAALSSACGKRLASMYMWRTVCFASRVISSASSLSHLRPSKMSQLFHGWQKRRFWPYLATNRSAFPMSVSAKPLLGAAVATAGPLFEGGGCPLAGAGFCKAGIGRRSPEAAFWKSPS